MDLEKSHTQGKGINPHSIIQSRILVAQKLKRDNDTIIRAVKEFFSSPEIIQFYGSNQATVFSIPRKNNKTDKTVYITGLSINAVKDLATIYKHLDYGIKVLDYEGRHSAKALAYCYDLQNNISETREFTVIFPEYIKRLKSFSDESYKILYAEGSRRMRSCIERILPFWLKESFFAKIKQIQSQNLSAHISPTPPPPPEYSEKAQPAPVATEKPNKHILLDWEEEFKNHDKTLTKEDLLRILDLKSTDSITNSHLQKLSQINTAIRMKEVSVEDVFGLKKANTESAGKALEILSKKL